MCEKCAKKCKNEQKCAKNGKIVQNVHKIAWNPKKIAQLEKISTDGVTSITIFFHLCVLSLLSLLGIIVLRLALRLALSSYGEMIFMIFYPHVVYMRIIVYLHIVYMWINSYPRIHYMQIKNCLDFYMHIVQFINVLKKQQLIISFNYLTLTELCGKKNQARILFERKIF